MKTSSHFNVHTCLFFVCVCSFINCYDRCIIYCNHAFLNMQRKYFLVSEKKLFQFLSHFTYFVSLKNYFIDQQNCIKFYCSVRKRLLVTTLTEDCYNIHRRWMLLCFKPLSSNYFFYDIPVIRTWIMRSILILWKLRDIIWF